MSTTTTAPHLGLCPTCEQDCRIRINGATVKHRGPDGPTCPGSGTQAAPLPLTFRRWLNSQNHRRGHGSDLCIGRLARYATRAYARDEWATADELADVMGRAGIRPDRDLALYLATAADEYEALPATSTTHSPMTDNKPAVPARIGHCRNPEDRMTTTATATDGNVPFDQVDRSYTSEFARGYALAVDWFEKGAPTSEAQELCMLYRDTRPGSPAEEATRTFDATRFPSLLAHLPQIEVFDGEEHQAESVRKYGASFERAGWPKRAFAWHTAGTPTHEGFLTAVDQVMEG